MTERLMAAPDPAAETAAVLARLGKQIDVVVPDDAGECWERATEEFNRSARGLARAGVCLLALKARLPHGEFLAGCEARHVAPRRAQEAMAVARLLAAAAAHQGDQPNARISAHSGVGGSDARISAPLPRALLQLSPSRLTELASVDPGVLLEAYEQGELDLIDGVDCMPVHMLRNEVRRLRQRREADASRLRAQDEQIWRLEAGPVAGAEQPASVTAARAESAALADQALASMAALRRRAELLLVAPDLGAGEAERARALTAAARPIALHAASVLQEASAIHTEISKLLSDWLPETWDADHQPPPLALAEARLVASWRQTHMARAASEQALRKELQIARGEIRRGPGRPRATERRARTTARKKAP